MLQVNRISFAYSTQPALDEVTFEMAPGEIVALTGANGAGKTTLLKILAWRFVPDTGSITLDAVNPLVRPVKYRRQLGYLSERTPLYEEMRVSEYLGYRAHLKGERTLRVRRRVHEALNLCGLSDVAAKRICHLSQGYRKRVSLAEAVMLRPRLLLLDDLLAGLDFDQRQKIAVALPGMAGRAGVLVAGHEIQELLPLCTRVLVLAQGRIALSLSTNGQNQQEMLRLIRNVLSGSMGVDAK